MHNPMSPSDRAEAAKHIMGIMAGSPIAVALAQSVLEEPPWTDWRGVKEQGEYWWWDGDLDSAPVPVSIMLSYPTTYFATVGQLGWNRPQDVEEMGGWWQLIREPAQPRWLYDNSTLNEREGA